jgi:hypothetical protein
MCLGKDRDDEEDDVDDEQEDTVDNDNDEHVEMASSIVSWSEK